MTTAGIAGWDVSQPNISIARATGISVPLPATQNLPAEEEADLSDNEIAYREVVRDCDIALTIRGPLRNPAAPIHDESCTFFEAIDGDGDTIMQSMPSVVRPKSLPAHPIFPLLGPPATIREGRLSTPIAWDGTPNLTDAQASALRKI